MDEIEKTSVLYYFQEVRRMTTFREYYNNMIYRLQCPGVTSRLCLHFGRWADALIDSSIIYYWIELVQHGLVN